MAIATESPEIGTLREEQALLRSRLASARRSLRLQLAMEALLDAAVGLVAVGLILVLIDRWLRFGLVARQVLLVLSLIGLASAWVARSIPRIRAARLDDLSLAMTLDRVRPGTGQEVADVLQLPESLLDERSSTSPAFVRLAVRRASESLAGADWAALWNDGRTVGVLIALLGALMLPAAIASVAPDAARLSFARWLRGSNERWPQKTYLSVVGLGNNDRLLAPRDEPFAVEVRSDLPEIRPEGAGFAVGGRGEPLRIRKKPADPTSPAEVRLRERAADGSARDSVLTAIGPARFKHEIPPASASSSFTITGGDDWLGPIRVERVDRPSLDSIKLRVRDPGAPNADFRAIEDTRQHLIFLPETEVELTIRGNEPIDRARVDVHPGSPPALTRLDGKAFVARWTLREATTLEIQVMSGSTGLVSKPSFLSLGLLKDREPRVTLRALGVGAHVTPIATIPLSIAATDDLGLSALRLQVERTTYGEEKEKAPPTTSRKAVPLPLDAGSRGVLDHQARHDVDLQTDPPPIGAVIRFQAEAEDRSVRGPQVGRSGVLPVQVVSPDELFYEILIRQRAERSKFIAALESTEKWGPKLAGSPRAEAATEASRSLHSTTRQLEQVSAKIADSLQEMKLNQVGSPKSHRLLQDGVIEPIRALNSGPVNELRGALQTLANGSSRPADAEKARKLHGEVVARMKAILDQMSQWESFVDVVNQVGEVIKIQKDVLKATEKARESRTEELFDAKP